MSQFEITDQSVLSIYFNFVSSNSVKCVFRQPFQPFRTIWLENVVVFYWHCYLVWFWVNDTFKISALISCRSSIRRGHNRIIIMYFSVLKSLHNFRRRKLSGTKCFIGLCVIKWIFQLLPLVHSASFYHRLLFLCLNWGLMSPSTLFMPFWWHCSQFCGTFTQRWEEMAS